MTSPTYSSHRDEKTSASPCISPGLVGGDEFLLRELFNPRHSKDGKLLKTAIDNQDLRFREFSVHHINYVTIEFVKSSIVNRICTPRSTGDPWQSEGVATFKTSTVRELQYQRQQAFVVIYTAQMDNLGYGKHGLTNMLLTLNLIAFAIHTTCDLLCELWKQARDCFSKRHRFFVTLDIINNFLYFENWHRLQFAICNPRAPP